MFWFLKAKCHKSQADRVLELLQAHKWEPVSLPMILDLRPRIAHHTECIRELRERGYDIECKSWFLLILTETKYIALSIRLKGFLFYLTRNTRKWKAILKKNTKSELKNDLTLEWIVKLLMQRLIYKIFNYGTTYTLNPCMFINVFSS